MVLNNSELLRLKQIRERQARLSRLRDTESVRELLEREAQAICDGAVHRVLAPVRESVGVRS